MPELPEVETVVRTLRHAVQDAGIDGVVYTSRRISRPNPRGWKDQLAGQCITEILRRGKYILIGLSSGGHLVVHLRMTGRFHLRPAGQRRQVHDRLVLRVGGGSLDEPRDLVLVDTRQFARADWCSKGMLHHHAGLSKLGRDANEVGETQLRQILARSHRPVKSLLLDQTAVAGLGNIYADECLFSSGIHPQFPADQLDRAQVRRLRLAVQKILAAAIAACGTTFDTFSDLSGEAGGFAPYLNVYQRDGQPCRLCRTPIERQVLAGRSAHFCPMCQPPPRA